MNLFIADVSDQVKQTLSNITEGLCHPLKSRIEHVISTEAPATVLYSVTTLIRFYRAIIKQVVPDSVLDQTLSDLLTLSEKSFLSRLQRETRIALGERAEPPGSDLIPAPSVSRLLSLLNEILSVASIAEDREKDMLQVYSAKIFVLLFTLCHFILTFCIYFFTFVFTFLYLLLFTFMIDRLCHASSIHYFKKLMKQHPDCQLWTWPFIFSIVCIRYNRR